MSGGPQHVLLRTFGSVCILQKGFSALAFHAGCASLLQVLRPLVKGLCSLTDLLTILSRASAVAEAELLNQQESEALELASSSSSITPDTLENADVIVKIAVRLLSLHAAPCFLVNSCVFTTAVSCYTLGSKACQQPRLHAVSSIQVLMLHTCSGSALPVSFTCDAYHSTSFQAGATPDLSKRYGARSRSETQAKDAACRGRLAANMKS